MLVLICAIRKLMECLFTRRELRVLDDLLPENSDKSRRKGGRSDLFRRLNWVNDDYEAEKAKEEARRRETEEQEAGFRRTRAMTNEMADFGKVTASRHWSLLSFYSHISVFRQENTNQRSSINLSFIIRST